MGLFRTREAKRTKRADHGEDTEPARSTTRSPLDKGSVILAWHADRRYDFPDECVVCGAPATGTHALRDSGYLSVQSGTTRRSAHFSWELHGIGHCADHVPKLKDGYAKGLGTGIKSIVFGADLSSEYVTAPYLSLRFSRPAFARLVAEANVESVGEAASAAWGHKEAALDILTAIEDDRALPLYVELIAETDASKRSRIRGYARAMAPYGARATDSLAHALKQDAVGQHRHSLIVALAELGDPRSSEVVDTMIAILRDEEWHFARAEAARYLGHVRDEPGVIDALAAAQADDPDRSVRMAATHALGDVARGEGARLAPPVQERTTRAEPPPMDEKTYLHKVPARLLNLPKHEEVDGGASSMRWIRDTMLNVDWIFMIAPADTGPEDVSTFIDESLDRAVAHRDALQQETGIDVGGTVCPVIVLQHAEEGTVAFVTGYMPKLGQAKGLSRWLFPVLVDLDAGALVLPERVPGRLQVGGVIGHANAKRARRDAEKYLVPEAVEL